MHIGLRERSYRHFLSRYYSTFSLSTVLFNRTNSCKVPLFWEVLRIVYRCYYKLKILLSRYSKAVTCQPSRLMLFPSKTDRQPDKKNFKFVKIDKIEKPIEQKLNQLFYGQQQRIIT